jgi:LPS-assembly lipoprotein
MWWSRRIAILLVAAALAGCGFQPLHGERGGDEIAASLARIAVSPILGDLGPDLADLLEQELAPRGGDARTRYRLSVILNENTTALVTERDTLVRRYDFRLNARYVLAESGSGSVLHQGDVRTVTSYNIVESADFATLVAEQSAGRRAAREIGRKIVERLTLYFDRGQTQ